MLAGFYSFATGILWAPDMSKSAGAGGASEEQEKGGLCHVSNRKGRIPGS